MLQSTRLTSKAIPLPYANVDTDQIIPARFLIGIDRSGLAAGLFADWRYAPDGSPNPGFVLNRPRYQGARILLAGENFGCGSSREHAVWALTGWGIRAVIAPSFADIFKRNALNNGLLPVALDREQVQALFACADREPDAELTVDLLDQTVGLPEGVVFSFSIDRFARQCLLEGQDRLEYLLARAAAINAYEAADEQANLDL